MKRILFLLSFIVLSASAMAQAKPDSTKKTVTISTSAPHAEVHIYNPQANAQADIDAAVARAKKANKHVLVQVGGNWCIWCIYFHDLVDKTPELSKYIADNYEWVLVNWSPEVKNTEVLNKLGNPGRFGYPNFVVLDGKGKVLHIQDSGYLERDKDETAKSGRGHNVKAVLGFLKNWNYAAVHASAK